MTIPELHENIVSYIGQHVPLKKVSAHEWAGACPACGGKDRLRVSDQRGWFCRKCGGEPGSGGHWGDLADFTRLAFGWGLKETLQRFNLDRRATPAEIEAMQTERRQREDAERAEELRHQSDVHDRLTDCADWRTYSENLQRGPTGRDLWRARGLRDDWQDYYGLGYNPGKQFAHDSGPFESASLTIPYFRPIYTPNPAGGSDVSWRVVGLQHRLLLDNAPGGKYRPHLAGAGKQLFYTDVFQRSVFGDLLIVEGEIKAMVTWSALWIGDGCLMPNLTVIGIPGQGWRAEWLEQFARAERIFVCLDPDAQASAKRLTGMIGDRARNILLPDKVDDLITAGVLDGIGLMEILEA